MTEVPADLDRDPGFGLVGVLDGVANEVLDDRPEQVVGALEIGLALGAGGGAPAQDRRAVDELDADHAVLAEGEGGERDVLDGREAELDGERVVKCTPHIGARLRSASFNSCLRSRIAAGVISTYSSPSTYSKISATETTVGRAITPMTSPAANRLPKFASSNSSIMSVRPTP